MKTLVIVFFVALSTVAFGQEMKIKWKDQAGREFSITAPNGDFSYGMLQGDDISYDYSGRVSKVGSVLISYDYNGHVSKVGSIFISYDYNGHVSKVGGLHVKYDYNGRVTGTSGSVN